MSRAELIYPIRERIEKELVKASADSFNAELLARYHKVRTTEVSPATVLTELIWLNTLSKLLAKKFEESTKADMEDLIFKMDQRGNKDTTKNRTRRILKGLFQWLKGCSKGEYPLEVKWIRMKRVPVSTITAEDLIPFEDVVRISEFAQNLRDRFLIQGKVDAGCRIGEILTMKISEIQFNDAGAIGYSDGKTGYKPIILTWSAKTLAQWLNIHPFRQDKDAPVFCLIDRETPMQMSYSAAYRAFKKCVVKSGIEKRVWFHLLKHISCTEDSRRGMPDSYRKFKHHWSPNTKMSAVYEHLSQADIPTIQNDSWKRYVGFDARQSHEQPKEIVSLLIKCNRCGFENVRDSGLCNRCGLAMNDNKTSESLVVKTKIEMLVNKLSENPDKIDKLLALVN